MSSWELSLTVTLKCFQFSYGADVFRVCCFLCMGQQHNCSATFEEGCRPRLHQRLFAVGNVGGSYIWQSTWGPTYRSSYMICIALSIVSLLMCYVFRSHLDVLNEELEKNEEVSDDERKGFRYML